MGWFKDLFSETKSPLEEWKTVIVCFEDAQSLCIIDHRQRIIAINKNVTKKVWNKKWNLLRDKIQRFSDKYSVEIMEMAKEKSDASRKDDPLYTLLRSECVEELRKINGFICNNIMIYIDEEGIVNQDSGSCNPKDRMIANGAYGAIKLVESRIDQIREALEKVYEG